MLALLNWVGCFGVLLQPVPPAPPAPKPAAPPTTVGATITLRDVDIAELISKLKLDLGYKLGGKLTAKISLSVPLNDAGSSKAYTVKGTFSSDELRVEGTRVQKLSADLVYDKGTLTLTDLKASLPPDDPAQKAGTVTGSATAAVDPRGDLSAKLKFTDLPLGETLKAVPGGVSAAGQVTGSADFVAPLDKITDPATWVGSADFTSPVLAAVGRTVKDAKVKAALKGGTATLAEASGVVEGIPLAGSGTLGLSGKYAFSAKVSTKPTEVSELQKLIPEAELSVPIKGKLDTSATAEGTLNPLSITASGDIKATDLTIGESKADKVTAKWKITPEKVTLSDLYIGVFKGTVTGGLDYPLAADATGKVNIDIKDVDAGAIVAAFPSVPVKVTGQVTGGVKGTIPTADKEGKRNVAADVSLKAAKLTVQGIPAEELTGKLSLEGTALKYDLEGKTLGGSFEVNGRYPEAVAPPPAKDPSPAKNKGEDKQNAPAESGSIKLRHIDLARLFDGLGVRNFPLKGRFDLTFAYSSDLSSGSGRYLVRDLGYGDARILPELSGILRLRNGQLEAGDISGPFGGGTLRARVRASLSQPTRNFFRLDAERVDVGGLLAAFTGVNRHLLDGAVSVRVRGKLYPLVELTGTIGLLRGRLGGITASDVRLPFDLFTRAGGGGAFAVREITGTFGNGRATGRFEYAWGVGGGRLDTQVKFTGVRAGNLLADLRQANYFGGARITGQIDLKGENVRSAEDLRGSVVATVGDAAARDLPVLDAVLPFVSPTALAKPFDTGELRGRLSRGVFRIERLTLASPNADVYADGNITVSGKLDLGVIVRTGNIGLNDTLLRQVGLALPLPQTLPLELVRDVSALLSNQTVRLTVGGTLANPRPQVNTAALFTDEAVRFLIRRYAPTAAAVLPEISPRNR